MSYTRRGVVTQSAADTFTQSVIDTNITVDGKAGWEITAFSAYWSNAEAMPAADIEVNAVLSTQATTVTTFDQDEEIIRLNWGFANIAGVAVVVPVDMVKREILFSPRLTVQPLLYVGASSVNTGLTVVIYYEIVYDIVKLTDLEVLRLLQGGA